MELFRIAELVIGLFVGVALLVVVCRANRNDLPAIVRAIMGVEMPGDDRPPKL